MRDLAFGFYGEGKRDYGFLILIIQRTLQQMLPASVIYPNPIEFKATGMSQVDKVLEAARQAHRYAILIVHLDADGRDARKAYDQRFMPGFEAISQEAKANKNTLPIIPIKTTDAWMLVDFEAFRTAVGTERSAQELGFPPHPHQVEAIVSPKTLFESAVRNARTGKRRRKRELAADEVYNRLAEELNLDQLRKVPAFQEFEQRLREMLVTLKYLEQGQL